MEITQAMKNASSFFRRCAWVLGVALIFVQQAAQACPGCKQNLVDGKASLNGNSIAFSLGVLFMIGMVVGVLGALGYMMNHYCRIIAAQQKVAMEQEDALHGLA